jgi:serpin B
MDASALPADVQDVEQSLNQFAIDLYGTITDANAAKPTDEAISPFSIAAALAMVYAGANGDTASQIAHALHLDLSPERFHAAMESILQDILPAASDTATQLDIANAIWGQEGFSFLDSFLQLTHDRYGADFHSADFLHAPGDAVSQINAWVRTQTHDMIKGLFDKLSNDTRLVLANALYFKASWATAFDASSTHRTVFHLASGSSADVSMMHSGRYYRYLETTDYQIAELPYQNDRYSMVILLPKQAGANLTVNFSAADLNSWLGALRSTDLSVALPKFKLSDSMSLIDTLQSLGVTAAFNPDSADLSGVDGTTDLHIGQAVHKAVVEVDETGTKAAAATGFGVFTSCLCPPAGPTPFYADHPFHFLIRDRETNTILFMGQVQHPTAYSGAEQTAVDLSHSDSSPTTGGDDQRPFQGPPATTSVHTNPFDVNADGQETPQDALIVINYINAYLSPSSTDRPAPLLISPLYPDVDGDGTVAALDVLLIINHLNLQATNSLAQSEGEAPASDLDSESIDLLSQDDTPIPTASFTARRPQ